MPANKIVEDEILIKMEAIRDELYLIIMHYDNLYNESIEEFSLIFEDFAKKVWSCSLDINREARMSDINCKQKEDIDGEGRF